MKKLLLLFVVLLGTVGAWGQLVKTSTAEAPIYYVMASYNRGGVITYGEVGSAVEHKACTKDDIIKGKGEWYFEAAPDNNDNGVYIVSKYKDGENKVYIGSDKKASTTPAVWYILKNGVNEEGYSISSTATISGSSCLDASNAGSGIGNWAPNAGDWHGTTWVFFEDVESAKYNPNRYIIQQGTGGRSISSITINSVTKSTSAYGLAYANHAGRIEYSVAAGSDVAISIARNGNWMHAYAYVDANDDGFTEEEAVSYSYLSSTGQNSAGVDNGNNTVELPNFKAPETAGTYRMRVKYDWDDLNPNGGAQFETAGSQFVDVTLKVTSNPLTPILPLAEALYNSVKDNIGTAIGEYSAEKVSALATAIEKAKAISDADATDNDANDLQAAMDAVKMNLPADGQYYQIHSSLKLFAEKQGADVVKAVYSNGSQLAWKTLNEDDKSFYWKAVATPDGGVVFQNAADNKYMVGNANQSGAWTMADEYTNASKASFKIFSKDENEKGYEYGVVLSNWQMHCNGHGNGAGDASNIVSWNTDAANSASAWYVVPVDLKQFFDVTYNFVYNEEVKYSTTISIASGAEYPEVVVPVLPYGIVADNATKPEGSVTENTVVSFTLAQAKSLPFKTATDVDNITTWYYAQMHANNSVTSYIEDNGDAENKIEWADKSVAASEIDSHLWGFVGDIWNGIKVVNKGTGRAIVSTSGNALMGEKANATAFVPVLSNGNINSDWFCLRYPNSNYLNAQGGIVASYGDPDNGSSILLTEYKAHEVEVGSVGYATLCLGSNTFIPETVEAYVVSGVFATYTKLEKVEGTLPANTGVVLKGEGTHTFFTSADVPATIAANGLKGVTEPKDLSEDVAKGSVYLLKMNDAGTQVQWRKLVPTEGANTTLSANKAYLFLEESNESRFLVFNFGDDTETAIESVEGENGKAEIYDLAGRRVQNAQKGVFIVNGKVVIK